MNQRGPHSFDVVISHESGIFNVTDTDNSYLRTFSINWPSLCPNNYGLSRDRKFAVRITPTVKPIEISSDPLILDPLLIAASHASIFVDGLQFTQLSSNENISIREFHIHYIITESPYYLNLYDNKHYTNLKITSPPATSSRIGRLIPRITAQPLPIYLGKNSTTNELAWAMNPDTTWEGSTTTPKAIKSGDRWLLDWDIADPVTYVVDNPMNLGTSNLKLNLYYQIPLGRGIVGIADGDSWYANRQLEVNYLLQFDLLPLHEEISI